jgi:hypothetical protein
MMSGFAETPHDEETQAAKHARAETECINAASIEREARAEMFNAIAVMLHACAKYITRETERK